MTESDRTLLLAAAAYVQEFNGETGVKQAEAILREAAEPPMTKAERDAWNRAVLTECRKVSEHEFFHDGLAADLHDCKDKAHAYVAGWQEAVNEIKAAVRALTLPTDAGEGQNADAQVAVRTQNLPGEHPGSEPASSAPSAFVLVPRDLLLRLRNLSRYALDVPQEEHEQRDVEEQVLALFYPERHPVPAPKRAMWMRR